MCETITWLASGPILQVQDMECNRDEALRSRNIAEQKFLQHDLVGAKRSALKAQCLFPDLDGLHQLLAVLDVHLTAQQKVNGLDLNWYGILQTDATADHATIRKQYRKLALILHPDKNKAVGADGAFKLISEAWRILSDKNRRAEHDAKRRPMSSPLKCSTGFRNFSHFATVYQSKPARKSSAFSHVCPSCKISFEQMNVEENKNLTCSNCGNMFTADDVEKSYGSNSSRNEGSSFTAGHKFGFYWAGITAKYRGYTRSTTEMVHEAYEMVKKQRLKAEKEENEKFMNEKMEEENAGKKHMKEKCKAYEFENQPETAFQGGKNFGNFFARAATFSHNCGYANNGEGSCSSFPSQQEQEVKLPNGTDVSQKCGARAATFSHNCGYANNGEGSCSSFPSQQEQEVKLPNGIGVSQKCGARAATFLHNCGYVNNGEGSCSSFPLQKGYSDQEQEDKLPYDGYTHEPDGNGVSQNYGDGNCSTVDCQYILSSKRKRIDA